MVLFSTAAEEEEGERLCWRWVRKVAAADLGEEIVCEREDAWPAPPEEEEADFQSDGRLYGEVCI